MQMQFDYSKLKGRMIEKFGSQGSFAKKRGHSERSISLKLNNKVPFTDKEILLWCELLDIDKGDLFAYFFTDKVQ